MWWNLMGFLITVVVAWLIADIIKYRYETHTVTGQICWDVLTTEPVKKVCQLVCPKGFFSLPGMFSCLPWLGCNEIQRNVVKIKTIGYGAVKQVSLCEWNGYNVVLNELRKDLVFVDDFRNGLKILQLMQGHPKVTKILGICDKSYMTQYFPLQSAEYLTNILTLNISEGYDTIARRFGLCLDYVGILKDLHNQNNDTLVMCDSSDLNKTLQQYLVREDLALVLNDVDSVARIHNGGKVKCGHRELVGEFVAPEQLWPYPDEEFSDEQMPSYDEKTDIWKIPDVCNFFLGTSSNSVKLKLMLLNIHTLCKSEHPTDRPAADQVLQEYTRIWQEFQASRYH